MNPTAAPSSRPRAESVAPPGLTLVTDPGRPIPNDLAATIRRPAPLRAAFGAFLDAVGAGTPGTVAVADDGWIFEGFAANQTAYAQVRILADDLNGLKNFPPGMTDFRIDETLLHSLDRLRAGTPATLRLDPAEAAFPPVAVPGWARGLSTMMAALSLPMRRVAIDRGGLFGLISALGRSRTGRASRSITIRWQPGRGAEAVPAPGARPVVLHTRDGEDGARGSVEVVVGHRLAGLAGLLPWVDSADLFLLGPGLPSFWGVRLGGIRVLLGVPSWTADGRLGSLGADPLFPPTGPSRLRMNQVVASFDTHPTQTREQVAERIGAQPAEVAAALLLLAARGQVLPDPESGRFRARVAVVDPAVIAADVEPVEVVAARSILATTSIRVARVAERADGRGRRVEGTILDRPVSIDLDPAGWMIRGQCSCSDAAGSLRQRGPCRHQLALQARAAAAIAPEPADLAAWFAGFPVPIVPA